MLVAYNLRLDDCIQDFYKIILYIVFLINLAKDECVFRTFFMHTSPDNKLHCISRFPRTAAEENIYFYLLFKLLSVGRRCQLIRDHNLIRRPCKCINPYKHTFLALDITCLPLLFSNLI